MGLMYFAHVICDSTRHKTQHTHTGQRSVLDLLLAIVVIVPLDLLSFPDVIVIHHCCASSTIIPNFLPVPTSLKPSFVDRDESRRGLSRSWK